MAAAQDPAGAAEHAELRATVGRIAAKFGGSYYAARAQAGQSCDELWQALAEAGFLGINIPSEFGGGGAGHHRAGHRLRGDRGPGLPAAAAAGVQRDLRRGPRPLRHRRAAGSAGCRGMADGDRKVVLRHHRARRRLEHATGSPPRPAATATAGVLNGTKYYISGRGRGGRDPGRRPDRAPDRRGTGDGQLVAVPACRRRRPGPEPQPARRSPIDAAREAVHAVLRRRPGAGRTRWSASEGDGLAPGLPRAQPGAHHRRRARASASAGTRWTRRPATPATADRVGRARSAATRASPTRWPRPRSRSSWPR